MISAQTSGPEVGLHLVKNELNCTKTLDLSVIESPLHLHEMCAQKGRTEWVGGTQDTGPLRVCLQLKKNN